MLLTLIFNIFKMVIGSSLMTDIKDMVEIFEESTMTGHKKWQAVWDYLTENNAEEIKGIASHLINLAIEISVAIVKR